jgi:hypothetical protein
MDTILHKSLREIFVMPTGLKIIAKMDGHPLYGSDKLNEKYIKALSKSGRTKPFIEKLQSLVDKGVIVPCFLTKGIPRFYAWKIFAPSSAKSIAGFYEPIKTKKVYILISNNANMFGYVSNNFMAKLTIHELMHRTASKMGLSFISSFKSELGDFYRELWAQIFSISSSKLTNAIVIPIVGFLFKNFELSTTLVTSADFNKEFAVLQKELQPLTSMQGGDFDRQLSSYIEVQELFIKDLQRFFQLKGDYEQILYPIYNAYKKAFGMRNLSTLCIQELIYPSEVMAISSEQGKKQLSFKALSRI